jgi:hypothetical protein
MQCQSRVKEINAVKGRSIEVRDNGVTQVVVEQDVASSERKNHRQHHESRER